MKKYAEVIDMVVSLILEFEDSHIPEACMPVQFVALPEDHQVLPGDVYTGDGFVRPEVNMEKLMAGFTERLWSSAHDHEYKCINGSAIGMLSLGVLLRKPKSLAVSAWIQSIWNLYYSRKPLVTVVEDLSLYDFSQCGPMPYSVPEIMQEVLSDVS